MAGLVPTSAEELADIVRTTDVPLAPVGHGTKSGLGHPTDHAVLDLSALSGVTLYEPEELVLSARAATPLAEIIALLDSRNQELAFEPPERSLLWGKDAGGTIGGLVATALSGPRRIKAGALRDHLLGLSGVTGRGDIFKAGGRVVKNVTGFDLSRGLAGSFGTLAVLTDVTLKVMPKAETETTLALHGLDRRVAVDALCTAMGSPADVSGAAILPAGTAEFLDLDKDVALIRLEGIKPSVEARAAALVTLLGPFGKIERVGVERSKRLWRAVRDLETVAARSEELIWRISVKPSVSPDVAAAIPAQTVLQDWSGGLLYVAVDAWHQDGLAPVIRGAIQRHGGGHATLMRAPATFRDKIPVFEPQSPALAALTRRLKGEFDPRNILNPGRMGEGR